MAVNVSDPLDGLGIHLKVGDEVVQQLGYGYSLRNRSGVGAPVDLLKPLPNSRSASPYRVLLLLSRTFFPLTQY